MGAKKADCVPWSLFMNRCEEIEPEFILFNGNLLNWAWYSDSNATRVFLHLLLTANHELMRNSKHVRKQGKMVDIELGARKIAEDLGMSESCVKTALKHLEDTGHISWSQNPFPRYDKRKHKKIISITNYDLFIQQKSEELEYGE